MQHKWLIASWVWVVALIAPLGAIALQFPNPSLEEDTPNIGLPDGWKIPKKDKAFRETTKVSHGTRAMRFVDSWCLMSCDLKAEKLAGLKLQITFDAAGTSEARYGVMIGKMRKNRKGKLWWENYTLHWGRKLTEKYQQIRVNYTMPQDAVGNRIFFAVYNLPGKGTVWLDNFNLLASYGDNVTKEQKKQLVVKLREWTYLHTRLDNALKQQPQNTELKAMKQESKNILDKLGIDDVRMLAPEYEQKLKDYQLKCNQILAQKKAFISYFEDAYVRLDSSRSIAAQRPQQTKLVTLGNEYQALGVVVASAKAEVQNLPITISGGENAVERIQVRRQVFMNNWYNRDKLIATDPLTLLKGAKGSWQLELAPGVVEKLYIGLKFKANLKGRFPLTIKVGNQTLIAQIEPRSINLPMKPFLGHLQCLYTWLPPSAPDAAKDLAEHYVTAIEFPICPDVRFKADGSLVQENVPFPNDVIKSYLDKNITPALFWQGYYKNFKFENGKKIPFVVNDELNPLWVTAYKNLLNAYFKTAARHGYTEKHFLNWIWDELGSGRKWAQAPAPKVRNAIKIYQASKAVRPKLTRIITAGWSTTPKDVQAYAGEIEIMLPHWTLPETSAHCWGDKKNNPRKVFFAETLPYIQGRQKNNNLTLWSYKIDKGKAEQVLNARAYPLCAIAMNYTGVGSWAYNVTSSNGTTWDDTDGGLLDYIFVYNGREKHPLNTKYNIVKERIVPSIRWEAFRMGIQDAKILLYLKSEMEQGKLPTAKQEAVKKILAELRVYSEKLNYTKEALDRISAQLRELI